MTPKIQKINNEIEKARTKITELEKLLPKLEHEKTELENAEIVRLIRSVNVTPDKLTAFIETCKTPAVKQASPITTAKQEVSNSNEK